MLDKLQAIEDKYLDLEAKISDPDIIADQKEWQKCTKAHAKLTDIVTVFREYRDLVKAKNDAEEIIAAGDDRELTEMAYDELKELIQLTVFTIILLSTLFQSLQYTRNELFPMIISHLTEQHNIRFQAGHFIRYGFKAPFHHGALLPDIHLDHFEFAPFAIGHYGKQP